MNSKIGQLRSMTRGVVASRVIEARMANIDTMYAKTGDLVLEHGQLTVPDAVLNRVMLDTDIKSRFTEVVSVVYRK